ncbi:MAG: bacteriohemerythrin [Candidatus Sericytochromatia bacterium]
MAFISWESSLSIGVNIIDEQHKQIIYYINELHSLLSNDKFSSSIATSPTLKGKVKNILDELVNYTITHFAFEEDMMQKANYQSLEAHKKVHKSFIDKVKNYQDRFERGEDIAQEVLDTLKSWLTNHIKREDKDYSIPVNNFLNKKTGWFSSAFKKFFG